eukprot:15333329-Ditylum_brightwellii.AAC.1
MDKIKKVMNKEDRSCCLIPIPCRMTTFILHSHITPQGLIIKPVTFGQALPKHLDDDAIGAFRQCKLHLDIAQSTGSLSEEPGKPYPSGSSLMSLSFEKYGDYTNAVQIGPLSTENTVYTQAVADSHHRGVMGSNGNPVPTPHN